MDPTQHIHDLQPYLHKATWVIPAVAGYMAVRAAWGARNSRPFIRRCVAGLSLAILLAMPLCASQVQGVWGSILASGLAFAAVGLTRQALVPATQARVWMKGMYRTVGSLGGAAALVALLGVASGNALVFSLGPSMWPTAAIEPTIEWLDTRAYKQGRPLPGDDIEFTVSWAAGAAEREGKEGWPTGRYRKRIWAIEGDVVAFEGNRLLVNGHAVLDCEDDRPTQWTRAGRTWQASRGAWFCFPDIDGDGQVDRERPIVWANINALVHVGKQYTLGPGELFVMGDNTIQSSDSREFGPIQAGWVDGRHKDLPLPKGKLINTY